MATKRYIYVFIVVLLVLIGACRQPDAALKSERIATAERYFRGVYTSDTTVVDDLTSDEIVISYPIFQSLYGTPAIRGHEAVKAFIIRFSQKWADPQFDIHQAISDGNNVVLLWNFQARYVDTTQSDQPVSDQKRNWGGITLFRFDSEGKIKAEIGEESEPGPIKRLSGSLPEQ